jgi:hypothetical protein
LRKNQAFFASMNLAASKKHILSLFLGVRTLGRGLGGTRATLLDGTVLESQSMLSSA